DTAILAKVAGYSCASPTSTGGNPWAGAGHGDADGWGRRAAGFRAGALPASASRRRRSTLAAWAVSPSLPAKSRTSSASRLSPALVKVRTLERFRKSLADRALANRAVPPVGSTWDGPA